MTEIPEHLLRRSRERRAALGGEEGGAEDASAATETATQQAGATVTETPRAAAPVRATAPPATQAGGAAPPSAPGTTEAPAEPAPRYRPTRTKTPIWAVGLLLLLPLWAIVYLGAFGTRAKAAANSPVTAGAVVYNSAGCSGCHGAAGQGGVGPALAGGEVLKVWPSKQDHINWVKTGGAPYVGKTIGATQIPVPANNVMPAFGGTLTEAQIENVVCYERVTFGGAPENAANCPATA
ncbi:MAG TPA: c-type cytochrome [Acidimicrobiales bacterium]|nr:c-type cytochrome [Acidimicrobiales bacterium]